MWNLELLSQGSRLTLIKSVLNSLHVYLIQTVNPPKGVLIDICRILARFFWGSSLDKTSFHWTKWLNLFLPLNEKGLTVINLANMAKAFAIKLWFKLRAGNTLWSSFMLQKYAGNKFPGICTPENTDSLI